jgi:hypothetical protein
VYSPQIIENYQLQSGEGLSVLFIVLWLFADISGLVGAIIAGLLPTLIISAAYVSTIPDILEMGNQRYSGSRSHSACRAWIAHGWRLTRS